VRTWRASSLTPAATDRRR